MSIKTLARDSVNNALRPMNLQVIRARSSDPAVQPFLPAKKTLAAARRSGLSLRDYIDQFSAEPGATIATARSMLEIGKLDGPVERVCEIGPGTGRYADLVIDALHPQVYEAYETATDWLPHLRQIPGLQLLPTDGRTLSPSATGSADLVHAHKLFVYLPLVVTVGYWDEMARVARPGGTVAFDIVTEECMDEAATAKWISQQSMAYMMIPRQWTVDLLGRRGLRLLGSSFAPLSGGRTELLVFRKEEPAA
jgi:hypothetical protein